jgi:hypothetical protein
MTTIAFDGKTLCADTLAVDGTGLPSQVTKLIVQRGFAWALAGERSQCIRLQKAIGGLSLNAVLDAGYAAYKKDEDDPNILIVSSSGVAYRHTSGFFMPVREPFCATGSGRDFALAAMHLGKSAKEAVMVASVFDVYTNGKVDSIPYEEIPK